MKKQWIALLTGCVLVCSMLAGCGSKPQTSAPAAAGSDKAVRMSHSVSAEK